MSQQPAKPLAAHNFAKRNVLHQLRPRTGACQQLVAQTLVWAMMVVIVEPPGNEVPQVPLAEDDKMIQDFVLRSLHPDLGVWIHIGRPRRNRPEFDTFGFKDGAELRGELAVPVTNDARGLVLLLLIRARGGCGCE